MSNFKFITICLLITVFISCNTASDKNANISDNASKQETVVNNLAQHVYYFGPSFDTATCDIVAECDCCTDDFIFFNEKDFIRIGNCISEKSVIKGIYSVEQTGVVLQYDSLSYFTEADENNELKTINKGSKEYLIQINKGIAFKDTIKLFNCKDKVFYKNDSEKYFGKISSKDSVNVYFDELKREGFLKKMGL